MGAKSAEDPNGSPTDHQSALCISTEPVTENDLFGMKYNRLTCWVRGVPVRF
jgi:hypothetical protein